MISAIISTNRFVLRPLRLADVNNRYFDWFNNQEARQYIAATASTASLVDLQQYIVARSKRADVLFLGIFEKITGLHIGNIKYEPVNFALSYAIMGIFVGEPGWRGRGVAVEVLRGSGEWLRQQHEIRQIILGVSRANLPAISAYKKVGFVEEMTEFAPMASPENITMVWHLAPWQ